MNTTPTTPAPNDEPPWFLPEPAQEPEGWLPGEYEAAAIAEAQEREMEKHL